VFTSNTEGHAQYSDFVDQIKNKRPITITGIYMTRFWIKSDAVCKELVKDAGDMYPSNTLRIIFSKTMRIYDVAMAVSKVMRHGHDPRNYKVVGFRPGEKRHETLASVFDKYTPINHDNPGIKDHTSQDYERYTDSEFADMIDPIVAQIMGEK
jgi:FlaA1/EpsC-like NDP-sugar epimerase